MARFLEGDHAANLPPYLTPRPLTPVEAVRKNVISQVLLLQKQRAMAHSKAQTESNLLACTTNLEYLSLIYAPAVSWLKYQEIRQ